MEIFWLILATSVSTVAVSTQRTTFPSKASSQKCLLLIPAQRYHASIHRTLYEGHCLVPACQQFVHWWSVYHQHLFVFFHYFCKGYKLCPGPTNNSGKISTLASPTTKISVLIENKGAQRYHYIKDQALSPTSPSRVVFGIKILLVSHAHAGLLLRFFSHQIRWPLKHDSWANRYSWARWTYFQAGPTYSSRVKIQFSSAAGRRLYGNLPK